ncbi:VOC family protein [Roseibium algae]|uniref:VOC family protein n=1 Tax=Roseibium algae TaxID=3123038 RepID=A0ABU8TN38_9HYPH
MARGLDHLVVAVNDLEAAGSAWEALGFTVTSENRHPWGTVNRIIQLDGFFVELLGIADQTLIEEPVEGAFSFGAFNRDFLTSRQGASMLVVESSDPAGDQAAYKELGLDTYLPFSFERIATFKDGSTGKVAFDLTFLTDALLPGLAFFSCLNRYPETFWNKEFQVHANGASAIKAVYLVAKDPSDHHEFLGGLTGQREMRATSFGLELETPRGLVRVLNPDTYRFSVGDAASSSLDHALPQIAAIELTCTGLEARKVIPANELFGLTLILSPAS